MPSSDSPLTTPDGAARHLCASPAEHRFTGKSPDPLIPNPYRINSITRAEGRSAEHCPPVSLFPMHTRQPKRDVIDLCYMPDGVHREYMLCGRMQVFVADPHHDLLLFIFTPTIHSKASAPYLQVYSTTYGGCQGTAGPSGKAFSAAIRDVDHIAVGHLGFVDVLKREASDYTRSRRFVVRGDRPTAMTFCDDFLIVGTKAGAVYGFDVSSGAQKWKTVIGKPVRAMCASKELVFVACVGVLSVLDVSDPTNLRRTATFNGHKCRRVQFGFDVNVNVGLVAAGGDDGQVRLWRLDGGDPIASIAFASAKAHMIKFVEADGKLSMWVDTKDKLFVCGVGEWGISAL